MVVDWGLSCKPITLILYSNFQIFITVVTGANYIAQLHSLTPEQPLGYLVKNRGRICYKKSRVIANFLLQFSNFRYHGNKGLLSKG